MPCDGAWSLCQIDPSGQESYAETKIFEKFKEFGSGKSSLREVLDMPKAKPFLVVSIPTKDLHENMPQQAVNSQQDSLEPPYP